MKIIPINPKWLEEFKRIDYARQIGNELQRQMEKKKPQPKSKKKK